MRVLTIFVTRASPFVFAFLFPILESPSQEAYALDERYRAYQEVILKLDSLHNAFPEITRLDSIRHPTQDRLAIWCLKISDNPFLEEEPAILLLGNQHREELLGGGPDGDVACADNGRGQAGDI